MAGLTSEVGHQAKSEAAHAMTLRQLMDLNQHPLGTGKGENFGVPSNYVIPPARIYVVNHSRTRKRREVAVAVSRTRGAEQALIADKELAKVYNVDTLFRAVESGRDMNRYRDGIHPVVFRFSVGGKFYYVPPAVEDDSPLPRLEVKEGAWDLFLGNYDRMRATKTDATGNVTPDATVIGEEKSKLAVAWRYRHNPVFAYTDDGVRTELDNPFGYIELIRETQKQLQEQFDKEYLAAIDLVEV